MVDDHRDKANALAKALDGHVVDDSERVEVSVKCEALGFPVTVEAIRATFPFGTNYYVNVDVLKEGNNDPSAMTLLITPKITKGIWNRLGRLLLLDAHVRPVGDPHFDSLFNMTSNDFDAALRFVRYPTMLDKIKELQQYTGFMELHVRAKAGLLLRQPTSLEALNLDVARDAVRLLGEMAQILFDVF
jgi:hypothetical protein